MSSEAQNSLLKDSVEAVNHFHSDAGMIAQGSHPNVLTFQVGKVTKEQKESTLFSGITATEIKASTNGISSTSSVCHMYGTGTAKQV